MYHFLRSSLRTSAYIINKTRLINVISKRLLVKLLLVNSIKVSQNQLSEFDNGSTGTSILVTDIRNFNITAIQQLNVKNESSWSSLI